MRITHIKRRWGNLLVLALLTLTLGCTQVAPPANLRPQVGTEVVAASNPGSELRAKAIPVIAPPDPNAPKGPDTTPQLNVMRPGGPSARNMPSLPTRARGPSAPGPVPTVLPADGQFGVTINNVYTVNTGAYAGMQVQPNLDFGTVSYDTLLYAPNLMPNNRSAAEVVVYYYKTVGNSMRRNYAVWNHAYGFTCPPSTCWVVAKPIDGTFMNAYARQIYSDSRWFIYTQINLVRHADGGVSWYVYLYNFTTSTWELQCEIAGFGQDGPPGGGYWNTGWSLWETHWGNSGNYCPPQAVPPIEVVDLRVHQDNSSNWPYVLSGTGLGSGGSTGVNFTCGYGGQYPTAYSNWKVTALI